jgi:hypothetical protein
MLTLWFLLQLGSACQNKSSLQSNLYEFGDLTGETKKNKYTQTPNDKNFWFLVNVLFLLLRKEMFTQQSP